MDAPATNPMTGEWMASDGKWYPAHLHHDPEYRARYRPSLESPEMGQRKVEDVGPPDTWPELEAGELPVLGRSSLIPALFAAVGALLGTVAVFLPWVDVSGVARGTLRGWDLDPDGQMILGIMLVIAFAAGALAAGLHNIMIKVACLVAGFSALIMAVDKIRDVDALEVANLGYRIDAGLGVIMLLGSGVCLIAAALFEHSSWRFWDKN